MKTNHAQNLETLTEETQKRVCRELKARGCTVALYDEGTRQLLARAYPAKKDSPASFSFPLGEGALGQAARLGKPVKTDALLAFPMKEDGKLVGVIGAADKSGGKRFGSGDLARLKKIAAEAGVRLGEAMAAREEKRRIEREAVRNLICGLSHYLKHLLHGISTGAAAVDNAMKQRNMGMLKKGWQVARQNEKKIANLVRDLIYLTGEKKSPHIPALPTELVRNAAAVLKGAALEKKVSLKLEVPDHLPEIMADPVALHRALHHVIANAVDACDQEQKKVSIAAELQSPFLKITVADTGHGIPAENLNRIFEPFFSTREHLGAGIGLAVAQKVVREHGGEVEVTSAPGKGTAVILKFPVKSKEKLKEKKKKNRR